MTAMPLTDSRRDLAALVAGRTPLVVVETADEEYAVDLVRSTVSGPGALVQRRCFRWSVTSGLERVDQDLGGAQAHNADPSTLLRSLFDAGPPSVYVLLDFHPYLDDPVTVRLLKELCQQFERSGRTLVLVSHALRLPPELQHLAASFVVDFPDAEERRAIVARVGEEWTQTTGRLPVMDQQVAQRVVANLTGLSRGDVERLARTAVFDDGALDASDLPEVMRAKHALLARDGILEFELDTVPMSQVAGMTHLKRWLALRRPAFDRSAPHLRPPKGVLLLGVQGCGKSMAAKAAAGMLGVPLLRLDMAAVHDKYVGESERRLRDAVATAEVMAPCVVWIDELEKALDASDGDAGASRRVLGTLLTWLQERDAPVFVVATANDVTRLPPELVRKGRFDEIFFVDLPDAGTRAQIAAVHCASHGLALDADGAGRLVAASDGCSGAEIEQAVVSATFAAYAQGVALTASHVEAELRATTPLSVVMAEKVAQLRAWAAPRTVPAG